MTAYYSDQLTANAGLTTAARLNVSSGPSLPNAMVLFGSASPSSALTTSDTVNMFVAPKGFRVAFTILESTDMDSGTTITLDVGDSGSQTRFIAAATVAQAGTLNSTQSTTGHGYLFTSDTVITIIPAAGPATTTGTLTLTMVGRYEGQAS